MNEYLAAYIRLSTLAICGLIESAISHEIRTTLMSYVKLTNLKVNSHLTNSDLAEALNNHIAQNRLRLPPRWQNNIKYAQKLMEEFQYSCAEHIFQLCRDDFVRLSIQSIAELRNELKKFFPFSEFKLLEQIFFNQTVSTRCIAQIVDNYIDKNKRLQTGNRYEEISENFNLACDEIESSIGKLKQDKSLVTLLSNCAQHFEQLCQIETDIKRWKKSTNEINSYSEHLLIAQPPVGTQQPNIELFIKNFEKKLQRYFRTQRTQYIRHLTARPEQINYRLVLLGSTDSVAINKLWLDNIQQFGFLDSCNYIGLPSTIIEKKLTSHLSWAYWLNYFVQSNLSIRSLSRNRKND